MTHSVVDQNVLTENKASIHTFIRHSYTNARKQLQDGMHVIQDGMNVIKEEFLDMYGRAESYLQKMTMPINNFIKDFTQIDDEFIQELNKQTGVKTSVSGCIVPIEQALLSPMEENY